MLDHAFPDFKQMFSNRGNKRFKPGVILEQLGQQPQCFVDMGSPTLGKRNAGRWLLLHAITNTVSQVRQGPADMIENIQSRTTLLCRQNCRINITPAHSGLAQNRE